MIQIVRAVVLSQIVVGGPSPYTRRTANMQVMPSQQVEEKEVQLLVEEGVMPSKRDRERGIDMCGAWFTFYGSTGKSINIWHGALVDVPWTVRVVRFAAVMLDWGTCNHVGTLGSINVMAD